MKQERIPAKEFQERYAAKGGLLGLSRVIDREATLGTTDQLVSRLRSPAKKPAKKKRTDFDGERAIRVRLQAMKLPYSEQFVFSEDRKYPADFAVGDVLIEYDGATYVQGGHSTGEGITRDAEKANLATTLGYKYLRFTVDLMKRPHYFEDMVSAAVDNVSPNPRSVAKISKKKKARKVKAK